MHTETKILTGHWLRVLGILLMSWTMVAFGQGGNDNLAVNPFREDLLPKNYSIEQHAGRNGQPGLVVRDGKAWYALPLEGVKPYQKYRYGVWVKTKDLTPGVRGATVFVTFLDEKGNFSEADAPIFNGYIGTRDWTYIEQEVTAPAKFERVTLNLYIGLGQGEAVFSEPFFRMTSPTWVTKMIYPAMRFGLEAGHQEYEFNSYTQNMPEDVERKVQVVIADHEGKSVFETEVPVENYRYGFQADLAEGRYVAKLTLLPENLHSDLKMKVVAPHQEPRVTVDGKGRFLVNGKLFLPIGIFTNMEHLRATKWNEKEEPVAWDDKWREEDTKLLIEESSPYNVILAYDSFWWQLEKPDLQGFEATQHMLDLAQKHNKMLILSVKDFHPDRITKHRKENLEGPLNITRAGVERFRNHPALLAWYVNDECEIGAYEAEQVELIGELDSNHPTLQVQYRPNLQFSALPGGDLIGLDVYPLNGAHSTQEEVCKVFQSANDGFRSRKGLAISAVPQIFSWYVYTHRRANHLPSVGQMRAVTLMMAAYGAKSFIFFAHTSLVHTPQHFDVTFEKVWNEGCEVANTVKELEPYILGEAEYTTPPLTVNSGEPVVRVMTADSGKQAVVITTVGQGTTDVVIQLDTARQFRSKYGKTKSLGDGKYQFTCEWLDCDVLEQTEP